MCVCVRISPFVCHMCAYLCVPAFLATWILYTNIVKYIHVLNVGVYNCVHVCACVCMVIGLLLAQGGDTN